MRQALASAPASAAATAAPPLPSPWILDRWRDLALFVATPLLILPAFLLARRYWTVQDIALFVAAFGALGHHFPGMLRAYGDKELFARYRARFIAAPLFLAAVCALFALNDLSGMILVAALWGVWHGMAQTYGFLRIYDARRRSFAPLTAKLDRAMCIAWFGVGLFLSRTRLYDILDRLYNQIGAPLVPPSWVVAGQQLWGWGTAAVTVVFVVHTVRLWRAGTPPSPVKLVLMATSFGFWIYASLTIDNLLVGVALFEVFHDVQYLAIVWIYNRNRVDNNPGLGGLMRFLFRRSGALIGVYVGLVFAYGALAFVAEGVPVEPLMGGLKGVLVASALLHFYYDGFIWRVRERSTRESLGLEGGQAVTPVSPGPPPWARHGARWLLFVLPVGWLLATELEGVASAPGRELASAQALVASLPASADAHNRLGEVLAAAGRSAEAEAAYGRALVLRPDLAVAHNNLALIWAEREDLDRELYHLREALRLDPAYAEAHNNLGVALTVAGRAEEAREHLREALHHDPEMASAHNNLGLSLAGEGRYEEAAASFRRALALDPDLAEARRALEQVLAAQRRR